MSFLRRLFAIPSLLELREDLESTQRDLRSTKADLGDLWERHQRLVGRLAKRGELNPAQGNGPKHNDPGTEAHPGALGGHAAAIQAQILARRGNHVSR